MDIQRVLLNLHRRRLPMAVLDQRAGQYVAEELITRENADCRHKQSASQRLARTTERRGCGLAWIRLPALPADTLKPSGQRDFHEE